MRINSFIYIKSEMEYRKIINVNMLKTATEWMNERMNE